MAKLAFDQLFRNGKPYMKRDDVLIDRIANGKLFELSDSRGYLKVFDIVVRFQDGSESKYKSSDLSNESVVRILKAEMLSCANQKGGKKKILLTGSQSDHDDSLTATYSLTDLEKTHHFGGQKLGGPKVNLGNLYEAELANSFNNFVDHGGKYPDHVTTILKAICHAEPGTCFVSAKQEGGANKPRPMRETNGAFYISAEGKNTKDIGKTVTDITLTIAKPGGQGKKKIYLSVKFGDTLSFFNIGVRGGGRDALSIFPKQNLQEGNLPQMGKDYLDMFNIDHQKFLDIFQKYDPNDKTPTVDNYKESYQITGTAKKNLENFCASGIGYGYWMVHYDGSSLHCYEVNKTFMERASKLSSSKIDIDYGGSQGYGKRVNINFSTQEYDFSFNIRSKSGSEVYPTHSNGDYFKK